MNTDDLFSGAKPEECCVCKCTVGDLGENCYIVFSGGRNDCVVIDPGDEPERILEAVGKMKISAVLLTHGHFDHIGAVDAVAGSAPVYIHSMDVPNLQSGELNAAWIVGRECVCSSRPVAVEDGQTIHAGGMDIEVIHTPGHTAGSVCYRIGNRLFSGDTVFESGDYGRTDLPGGDEEKMVESLRKLLPLLPHVRLYGGHG